MSAGIDAGIVAGAIALSPFMFIESIEPLSLFCLQPATTNKSANAENERRNLDMQHDLLPQKRIVMRG
jgi:hypothetical protein